MPETSSEQVRNRLGLGRVSDGFWVSLGSGFR